MTDLAAGPHGRLAAVRDALTPTEWARAGGMTGSIIGLHGADQARQGGRPHRPGRGDRQDGTAPMRKEDL